MTALSHTSSTSTDCLPTSWVEKLFDRMLLAYGKKFTDQWAGADPDRLIAHWGKELGCFTRDELARGAAALESRDWPPTLPEFKRMCRPPVDPLIAYYEALNGVQARERGEIGEWSHPAIYWAAVKVSSFDLRHQSFSQIRDRWEKTLAAELAKGEWAPVPAAVPALQEPGTTQLSKEEATKRLVQLGAAEMLKPRNDHKAWARKLAERAKRPNHGLSALQLRSAAEALSASQG